MRFPARCEFTLELRCVAALVLLSAGACSSPDGDAPDPVSQGTAAPSGRLLEDERNTIDVFEHVSRSVVFITTSELRRNLFTAQAHEVASGSGSGFVWDRDGHVVTNAHVVLVGRSPNYTVTLAEGTQYEARLIGIEPEKDLAVLKIEAPSEELVPVEPGDSDNLIVGQKVLAIGNPFGFDQTLTTGVISALGREIQSTRQTTIRDVIQTDASINPGNSGGPLLDSGGRLIGVNTAIVSPSRGSSGIGFAVPVATVKRIVPQLIQFGEVQRVGLGVNIVPDSYARRAGIARGVIVQNVEQGSAAAAAGLESPRQVGRNRWVFDVIVEIDGQPIVRYDDLYQSLDTRKAGERVKLRFVRDRREYETEVVLQELEHQ